MSTVKDIVMTAVAVLGMSALVVSSPMPRPAEEQEQVVSTGVRGAPLAFPFRYGVVSYEAPVRRCFVTTEESQSLLPKLEEPKNNGANVTRPVRGWRPQKGLAGLGKDKVGLNKTARGGIAKGDDAYEGIWSDEDGEVNDEYDKEGVTEDPDDDNADGENTGEEDDGW